MKAHRWDRLAALCLAAALLLSACGKAPETPEPTASPLPVPTVDPTLSGEMQALEQALLEGARPALALENAALSENSRITSVRIPDQTLHQFLDVLSDGAAWQHTEDGYYLNTSSGGDFTYEKPYSELIEGSATDVFTIEDETGLVEEIVDNVRYDPFTWVMSGEGGGDFVYATAYWLADSGQEGRVETVSRLNGSISGWSYDLFQVADGQYRFLDIQLSPDENGAIQSPYRWAVCVGWIGANAARIEEYELRTDALERPLASFSLSQDPDALFAAAAQSASRRTQLTAEDGQIQYQEY